MTVFETGQSARVTRVFSRQDVEGYASLCGHRPPGNEVPEPLINSLFSMLLGTRLPGLGTNYLKQASDFHAAARVDEQLEASVEITRLRPEKNLVDLRTRCRGEDGRVICDGRALVYIADVTT